VGLPYHWGTKGLSTGDSANDLFSVVLDANVHIQETKAASCDIRPGRRPRGPALRELVESYPHIDHAEGPGNIANTDDGQDGDHGAATEAGHA
jgi:formate dehydrogenase major subunit